MGMYHSTSGKRGFEPYQISTDFYIEKEVLRSILIREDELRSSEEYQQEWTQNDDLTWIRDVAIRIQQRALAEHGITDTRGLTVLQNARFKYKDDPTMNSLTVYMREDRSKKGNLRSGDEIPDSPLFTLEGISTTLHKYIKQLPNLPLIILSGSIT